MKKFLSVVILLLVALVVVPPLWFSLFPSASPPELPPAGRRVELPTGVGINMVEAGSGPPVMLVHGLPGSAYDWRLLVPLLADRGYHVMAIDRSGYGHSDPDPAGEYSVSRNARDVASLVETLGLSDVTLVGWSYGGATATTVGASQPPWLSRMVLVGTAGPDGPDAAPPEPNAVMKFMYSDAVMRWRSAVPPLGRGLIEAISVQAFSEQPMPDWWVPGVLANFRRWETLSTYKGEIFGVRADEGFDYADIEAPTLLLHGDDDRLAPVEISRYLVTQIPDATLIETAGASHMLPVTHAEETAERIDAFIGSHAASEPEDGPSEEIDFGSGAFES